MNRATHTNLIVLVVTLVSLAAWGDTARGQCKVSEGRRKFEGAERTVVTVENPKILMEIAPELEGRVIRYIDKQRPTTPLEWLDDCPYHYAGRWEGKPFTYRVDAKSAERAAVTVIGGGKISVALLRSLGYDVANPLDLTVERTMSIEPNSTRLRVEVKITNVGGGVAPQLRYMVHAVYGQVPPLANGGRAFWFLPTAEGVEFFNDERGYRDMGASAGTGGAPINHAFSRFMPGQKADKPRFEAGGWGALLTSAGPTYIYYDPASFDFMQYWFGGDAEWHFTFEPHSKPVDLKPGDSVRCQFTLAYDSVDVPFNTPTVAFERPTVSAVATPGSDISINLRATTVALGQTDQVKLALEIKDPAGKAILAQDVGGEIRAFAFTDLGATAKLPSDAPLGPYQWTAKLASGKVLGSGQVEVLAPNELERRKTEAATVAIKAQYEGRLQALQSEVEDARKTAIRWTEGMNLALSLDDRRIWPNDAAPHGAVSVGLRRQAVAVEGLWKEHESIRFKKLEPVASPAWPAEPDKLLGPLAADRGRVRDVALTADGRRVVALLVDAAQSRAEIVSVGADGANPRRFGRFSDKPGEYDDTLGAMARALAVDSDGNIWVATNTWGQTSRHGLNQDGAPFEESIIGAKGAVKKFAPDGKPLGAVSTLDAPMDLVPALADGTPVMLASYRHVSSYYGAQVKQGVMIIGLTDTRRLAEIKIPAGSVCVDKGGQIWSADVAGHVAPFDLKGRKLLDVAGSAEPAVLDAKLPAGSPLPVSLRATPQGNVWALATLKRNLSQPSAATKPGEQQIPAETGSLWKLLLSGDKPIVLGEKSCWVPQ